MRLDYYPHSVVAVGGCLVINGERTLRRPVDTLLVVPNLL